jgi:hypothetical protein
MRQTISNNSRQKHDNYDYICAGITLWDKNTSLKNDGKCSKPSFILRKWRVLNPPENTYYTLADAR